MVRLDDGTTVYAFGAFSVFARSPAGTPDRYWQGGAEKSVAEAGGDLRIGLTTLPGSTIVREGVVRPVPAGTGKSARSGDKKSVHTGRRRER